MTHVVEYENTKSFYCNVDEFTCYYKLLPFHVITFEICHFAVNVTGACAIMVKFCHYLNSSYLTFSKKLQFCFCNSLLIWCDKFSNVNFVLILRSFIWRYFIVYIRTLLKCYHLLVVNQKTLLVVYSLCDLYSRFLI